MKSIQEMHEIICRKFGIQRFENVPHGGTSATRERLAEIFAEAGFQNGAEIGVRYGNYSEILCRANPGLKLLSIDPWTPYRKHSAERMELTYQMAKEKLAIYNAILIRKTSLDAVRSVADGSLDFVYIDAMHEFDPVIQDIIHWAPKVRDGGIISGHDYAHYYQGGVVAAVEAYTRAHGITTWYVTQLDREPSWLWVKCPEHYEEPLAVCPEHQGET